MKNVWRARNKETGKICKITSKSYGSDETTYKYVGENGEIVKVTEEKFESEFEYLDNSSLFDEVKDYIKPYLDLHPRLKEALQVIWKRNYPGGYFKKGALVYFEKPFIKNVDRYGILYDSSAVYVVLGVRNTNDEFIKTVELGRYKGVGIPLENMEPEIRMYIYEDRVENEDAYNYLSRFDTEY